MSWVVGVVLLFSSLPTVAPLFCYTCVVPAVSPLDCIQFPVKCPPDQLCLSSRAVGHRGDFQVVLYEKSCVLSSLCGVTGQKYTLGLNFTFTNHCCETNLCNAAPASPASPAPPASPSDTWFRPGLVLLYTCLWFGPGLDLV